MKVLLVDDEPDILEFLGYNLRNEGYETITAENGVEAIEIARKELPDLIALDVMMPKMDGVEACIELRKIPELSNTIIVFLTARGEDYSQIAGLEAGADDYITKPVKPKVFLSKVKSLLRRAGNIAIKEEEGKKDITIDLEKYLVYKNNSPLVFPRKEFELLSLLMSVPGRVFERDEILKRVWGNDVIVGDRTIDVHIRKLREKLGSEYITTIKGVGYKFEPR